MNRVLFVLLFFLFFAESNAQNLVYDFQLLENFKRNAQLGDFFNRKSSFIIRPVSLDSLTRSESTFVSSSYQLNGGKVFKYSLLPIFTSTRYSSSVPFQSSDYFLPLAGFQNFTSLGVFFRLGFIDVQFSPEIITGNNPFFETGRFKSSFTEYLERYGENSVFDVLLGQSSVKINFGKLVLGFSNENIWWGPGKWNSLTFSNNAFGFKHLSLNSTQPLKTFFGNIEGQILMGRLEGSGLPSFVSSYLLNDWRYLNGIILSINPNFIPNFFAGFSRTFQQYDSFKSNSFSDFFPIFNAFQKIKYGFDKDQEGRDQQATLFGRLVLPSASSELYFEFGRRDHAFDWREALLNPEHARSYLIGFSKIFKKNGNQNFALSGEIFHQQESINILVRYPGTGGGSNWAGHSPVFHGFTNRGQLMNTGFGPSSNVQSLDLSWNKGINSIGLKFDRVNRHQDIFTKFLSEPSKYRRWVDLRVSPRITWEFSNFLIHSNLNFVGSFNNQWETEANSSFYFPQGKNNFSFHSEITLVYKLDFN